MAAKSRNLPILKVAYARVSTHDQNPDLQIAALKKYGVPEDMIFVDHASGGTINRPNFIRALKTAQRVGSQFVVWKLDRLGRTVPIILDVLDVLEKRGVKLVSLTEQIDTSTPMGKAFLHMAAMMAQLERDLIQERTLAGIARARERGERGGRPVVMSPDRIAAAEKMLAEGSRGNDIWPAMRKLPGPKISRAAYYKWQQAWDIENKKPKV